MNRLLSSLVIAIALAMGGPAVAADMPVKAAPAPIAAAPYNWTGWYIGANAGWAHDSYDWAYSNPAPATCCAPFSTSKNSWVYGGHTGFQVQWNQIVLGVEAALLSGARNFTNTVGCVAPNSLTLSCQLQRQTTLTAGGRLGWALNTWLIYVDGGFAQASIRSNLFNAGTFFDFTQARYHGWYVGGGVEHVVYKGTLADLIVGLEYQHIDFGTKLHLSSLDGFTSCPPGVNCRNIAAKDDILRARLSLKWNPFPALFR